MRSTAAAAAGLRVCCIPVHGIRAELDGEDSRGVGASPTEGGVSRLRCACTSGVGSSKPAALVRPARVSPPASDNARRRPPPAAARLGASREAEPDPGRSTSSLI